LIVLQKNEPHATEILKGMGNTLSNLSELRNNKSLAHPNELLLPDDEATFTIESVNAILRYLSSKLD
ncbi:MAG: abortive infection family protein, partial [Candidatus Moraniibacteriota bacterium]